MKNLDLNSYGVQKLNGNECIEITGGGKFQAKEAVVAFALMGLVGVGVYWYFCD